ncbi:hypothetical protein CWM47_21195 [Spirosoma pollinicola]|uniref:Uncharacterized protein n=1 Tax=Spirosoma pollinicola TaxID=2057025 RepID=A0A2K8Z2P8_9BACT|nr:hypothetical protein CWM47_21195 [Spirosoma pollinicola]
MVCIRQIGFEGDCPSIVKIINQISQLSGIEPIYSADRWLLINSQNQEDVLNLYQEDDQTITLTYDGKMTDLVRATCQTLLQMGGYYTDEDS